MKAKERRTMVPRQPRPGPRGSRNAPLRRPRARRHLPSGAPRRKSAMKRLFSIAGLVCALAVCAGAPAPAHAEADAGLRNANRAVTGAVQRSVRASLRILPKLGIVRGAAGAVSGLHMSADGGILFVLLDDGTARLWDLERGVQAGAAIGQRIAAGALRGAGTVWEAIAANRDGAVFSVRSDGKPRRTDAAIAGIDPDAAPALSGDGSALAFRAADGGWRVRRGGQTWTLPGARRDFAPILSRDGARALYLEAAGAPIMADLSGAGAAVRIGGCADGAAVTAGALAPDGARAVFGDERGNVCARSLAAPGNARLLFVRKTLDGAVRAIALDRGGAFAAVAGGGSVAVLALSGRFAQVAAFALEDAAAPGAPLLLDATRRWVFAGQARGTVGVYALDEGRRIARLVSTDDSWAVIDRQGRFDGPHGGVQALAWEADTPAQTLPVDAFSERWYEPGLLAKLDDAAPAWLNDDIDDLSETGYIAPPAVSIDPIDASVRDSSGRIAVTVRVEPGYDPESVAEMRLYRNGKLAGRSGRGAAAAAFPVAPLPGENRFRAVGVGPGEIDGPPATAVAAIAEPTPRRPEMRVVAAGVNDYTVPAYALRYSRNDAEAVAALLRERAGNLFGAVEIATLLDASATGPGIRERVLRAPAGARDVLIVYLAGHGKALRGKDGWEWYFLPFAEGWGELEVPARERVRRYGLSSRELMTLLTGTPAQRVFLVLDSCHSGALIDAFESGHGDSFDDAAGQKALRRMARVGGIHVLAAARAHELAAEVASIAHGALTWLVLEGMRGAADDNGDGAVSVREVIAYAGRTLPFLPERLKENIVSHKPVGYSRGEDFAIAGAAPG